MYGSMVACVTFMKTCDFLVIMIDSLDEMKEAIMVLFPSHRLFFGFDLLIQLHAQKYLLISFAFHQCSRERSGSVVECLTRD